LWKKTATVSHYRQQLNFAAMLAADVSSGSATWFNRNVLLSMQRVQWRRGHGALPLLVGPSAGNANPVLGL
jgi:hypothetical protein